MTPNIAALRTRDDGQQRGAKKSLFALQLTPLSVHTDGSAR